MARTSQILNTLAPSSLLKTKQKQFILDTVLKSRTGLVRNMSEKNEENMRTMWQTHNKQVESRIKRNTHETRQPN